MAKIQLLTNPPITEALIDLRIKPEGNFPIDELDDLAILIGSNYPLKERREIFTSQFEISPKEQKVSQSTHKQGLNGYFFTSEDRKDLVQFSG
ncbi:MAG: TIGR04255 family protein [Anaerolineae bacterium]|nr:TIGR04255 family protein [Anaerolineae bacterium]